MPASRQAPASLKPPRVQPGPGAEQAAGDRRGEQLEAQGIQGLRRGRSFGVAGRLVDLQWWQRRCFAKVLFGGI